MFGDLANKAVGADIIDKSEEENEEEKEEEEEDFLPEMRLNCFSNKC